MDNAIYLCSFCGETCKGKYCNNCNTKEKRKELIKEQLELEKTQKNPCKSLFGFNRENLLKQYGL